LPEFAIGSHTIARYVYGRRERMTSPVDWEKVTRKYWSSSVGYVSEKDGVWTAYVYRNVRCGKAWTEQKPGFLSLAAAKRWVEQNAEE